jgi:hypothetical protein
VLILSTPALDAVTVATTVTTVFDTTAPKGVMALGGALVPGTTPPFDVYVVWVALAGTVFEGAALAPFDAADTFIGIAV